jgi:hypothetical protein
MLGMAVRRIAYLAATATLVGAVGSVAHAATVPATQAAAATSTQPMDFTVRSDSSPLAPGQVLKWDAAKGKWGVILNLQQPETRSTTLNDIQAGAYYKITPALRVGGSFSFGAQPVAPGPKPNTPDNTQPRVQLETKFKF